MENTYPESITKNRLKKEGLLLGDLFNDLLLIKEYKIDEDMFITDKGRFYYTIMNGLIRKDIFKTTDADIRLIMNDNMLENYEKLGGFETIKKLMKASSNENFDAHFDAILKNNLLMSFIDDGIDLNVEIEIKNKKGKVINKSYLEVFENMNTEQILAFMQTRISESVVLPSSNGIVEDDGFIDDDFIKRLTEGNELGASIENIQIGDENIKFMPMINKEVLGLRRGGVTGIAGLVNQGKSTVMVQMAMGLVGQGEKVLYITNEMKIDDIKINCVCYILANILKCPQITKKKLKSGDLNSEELKKIKVATQIFNENLADNMYLVSTNDADFEQLQSLTRKYALSKGITCLLYDTFKAEYNTGEEDYKDLIMGSRIIDKLCREYDLVGVIALQVSQSYANNLTMDISLLAGAKQINEVLDTLIMFRNVFKEELDMEHKYYIEPHTWYKDELTGDILKKDIVIDPKSTYRVAFIVKTRDGSTFNDTNVAYLWSFQGKNASIKEICRCSPKRGTIFQNYR